MIINQATLAAIYKNFKTVFNEAFSAANPLYKQLCTIVPSSAKSEEYKWLGNIPRMREWIGERIVKNLKAHGWTIKNKDWESTIEVDRNDIDDDSIGVYKPLVAGMGNAAAMHPDEIVFALLFSGFSTVCYDGQYFFDTDHPGAANQSNKGTAVLATNGTAYAAARAAMMAIKDDKGNPLSIIPDLLVVPPQLESVARTILNADTISGTTNLWKGSANLLLVPELAGHATAWYLACTKRPIKPIMFQQRKKPVYASLNKDTDENVFWRKKYVYGVDSRDNAGYGLWQLMYGSTGAG